jgi:hypothetical protein
LFIEEPPAKDSTETQTRQRSDAVYSVLGGVLRIQHQNMLGPRVNSREDSTDQKLQNMLVISISMPSTVKHSCSPLDGKHQAHPISGSAPEAIFGRFTPHIVLDSCRMDTFLRLLEPNFHQESHDFRNYDEVYPQRTNRTTFAVAVFELIPEILTQVHPLEGPNMSCMVFES